MSNATSTITFGKWTKNQNDDHAMDIMDDNGWTGEIVQVKHPWCDVRKRWSRRLDASQGTMRASSYTVTLYNMKEHKTFNVTPKMTARQCLSAAKKWARDNYQPQEG